MTLLQMRNRLISPCWWMLVVIGLLQPLTASAEGEEKFDVLQIGAHTYRNVTVTTKSKTYIFIVHSEGMANIKIIELPDDVRTKLGYADPKQPVVQTNGAAAWAKQTMAKLNTPEVQDAEKKFTHVLESDQAAQVRNVLESLKPTTIYLAVGTVVLIYLFNSYCCRLICAKAGHSPSPLIWLPILKAFPLLRAAGMSGWWFLALFVPLLNIVAGVLWTFKIVEARGKNVFVSLLLLLPPTSLFAFLYLAFSAGNKPARKSRPKMEGMVLEPA